MLNHYKLGTDRCWMCRDDKNNVERCCHRAIYSIVECDSKGGKLAKLLE